MANICFMEKLLIRLIEEHDSIIIPDFGTLLKSGDKIIFNSFLKFNDGKLQKALSEDKGISLDEAKEEIQKLANHLASQAESGETAVIEGLGSFYKDSAGSIVFTGFSDGQAAPEKPKDEIKKEEKPEPVKEEKKEAPKKEEEAVSNADKELDEALDNSNDEVEKEVPPAPVIEAKKEKEVSKKEDKEEVKPEAKKTEKPAKEKKEKKEKKKKPTANKETTKKEKKETPKPPVEEAKLPEDKINEKAPKVSEEVKEEEIEAPFFDKNDRLEEKVLDKPETAVKADGPKKEVVSKAEAMAHVAPEVDGHELPPVEPQPKKKKKKRFIWLVLLLLLIGGGVFAGLKWDMVSEWIGLKDKTEKKAEDKEKEPENKESKIEEELSDPIQDDAHEEVLVEESDSSEIVVDDEIVEDEVEPVVEEVIEEPTPDPEPVVVEPTVTQNAGSSSGSHHVIAGAFTSKGNADALVTKLQGQGFSSARLLGRFNGEFYQVAAGSYNSASEANAQLSGVNAAIGGGAWVLVKDL